MKEFKVRRFKSEIEFLNRVFHAYDQQLNTGATVLPHPNPFWILAAKLGDSDYAVHPLCSRDECENHAKVLSSICRSNCEENLFCILEIEATPVQHIVDIEVLQCRMNVEE